MDPWLHTPMCFFLATLSLLDTALYLQLGASGAVASAGTSADHALSCLSYPDALSSLPGTLGVLPAHSHVLWPPCNHLPSTALPSPHGPKNLDGTSFNLLPSCLGQRTHPHHPCTSTQVLQALPHHPLLLWPPSTAQTHLLCIFCITSVLCYIRSQLCILWLERPGALCAVCGPHFHAQPHHLHHAKQGDEEDFV